MLVVNDLPWVSVSGYGAHIKSTQRSLVIQRKNQVEEYPLDSIKNLLIVGGHTISSSTINSLIRHGAFISFFESDGTPSGTLRPFCHEDSAHLNELQRSIPRHRLAVSIAQGAIKSRLMAIERCETEQNIGLLYEGELEILQKSLDELTFLIKMDEIRRLHRLTSDMYYEIMSRDIPAEFGFRRRTPRPQIDPVNAMLSFGYALLFGNCSVAIIGARLNPDLGCMHDGKGSLVLDLIEPLKATMIDPLVFQIARNTLSPADYELSPDRCLLSEELIRTMIPALYSSINKNMINHQVLGILDAIENAEEFKVLY